MIESVEFKNFKALRDAKLPLGRFTLIVGPNGSGKSTVFQALKSLQPQLLSFHQIVSAELRGSADAIVEVVVSWGPPYDGMVIFEWNLAGRIGPTISVDYARRLIRDPHASVVDGGYFTTVLQRIAVYSLDAEKLAQQAMVREGVELGERGEDLPAVLDRLSDQEPERFEALNAELGRCLPEYDRILFEATNSPGTKAILLRTRDGGHRIPAADVSQGTLLTLALLTIAYQPHPPSVVCLEEPDRGIHPRLLAEIRDAMYRLSHPESFGEDREPVQVIATTHSPYLLDLYRDHPEEVVIAEKLEGGVRFERLSDYPHVDEILQDARLGDVWYTGILGGVPSHT
ncbi:MAG TPA: AAA family ATPase [Blastocatellia bacterium]|nr:AAA family ATPase [Blastocatellia bacterium]